MFYAFFRYIFWILPLLLATEPRPSSTCDMRNKTTIRGIYKNILSPHLNELQAVIEVGLLKIKVNNISSEFHGRVCNDQENSSAFLCNDTQEIESLQNMACNLIKFFNGCKGLKDFRKKACAFSQMTLDALRCTDQMEENKKNCTDVSPQRRRRLPKCAKKLCEVEKILSSLRSCWNKFEKETST